ncbi:MAG: RsmE family RNA methyltransferase [Lentisphaeria bacterium]|nr:RsmE family RNA methyltransferase [Lentisphaeria bacterium]
MHRVFCDNIPAAGGIAEIETREKEHLFKVFRAAPGDRVELLDGRGTVAAGIVEPGKLIRVETVTVHPEPEVKLHLCCALPRKQKLDQMLKQAAELGAWSIRPLNCIRSVAEGGPKERWDLLLREACKQSGNPFMPRLYPEERLAPALKRLQDENIAVYYGAVVPGGEVPGSRKPERALLIGPEGGFAPEEITLMEDSGAEAFNFAPYILRLETAAVCGLTALRMLGMVVCAAAALFFCGCEKAGIDKNPLMIKGAKLRDSGDYDHARRYFRQAVALNPETPEAYLALAQLCDEHLDDPLEALYCYRMYLQYTPPDAPEHQAVKALCAMLEKRAVEKYADIAALKSENAALLEQIAAMKRRSEKVERKMIEQQMMLIRMNSELNAEKQKRLKRRKK